MGRRQKEAKTRITHTLEEHEGPPGFDFLGFHIRQYRVGKYRARTYRGRSGFKTLIQLAKGAVKRHVEQVNRLVHRYRTAPQSALITAPNPVIRGWTNYHRTGVAKCIFNRLDRQMDERLMKWAGHRHPRKSRHWRRRRYWRQEGGRLVFSDGKVSAEGVCGNAHRATREGTG